MSEVRDESDWRILRKILVTTTTGVVAYLLTNLTAQPRIWGITMSVFVAGVVLVVQFLIDFDGRLRRRTRLSALVEQSAARTDPAVQLITHWTQMEPNAPVIVSNFARWHIEQTSTLLRDLNEGLATYSGEDWTWLFGLTETATKTIDATSLNSRTGTGRGVDEGIWTSDQGRRYLQMQRKAVERGVRIRRIFILDPPGEAGGDASDPAAQEAQQRARAEVIALCRLQHKMGIDVRILDPSVIEGPDNAAHSDFILFDGALSYEIFPAVSFERTTKPLIFATHLERRPPRVDARKSWFEGLWQLAVSFDGYPEQSRDVQYG